MGFITEMGAGVGGAGIGCGTEFGVDVVRGTDTDIAGRGSCCRCGAGILAMWTTISVASDVGI